MTFPPIGGGYAEQNQKSSAAQLLPDFVDSAMAGRRSLYTSRGVFEIGILRAFYNKQPDHR